MARLKPFEMVRLGPNVQSPAALAAARAPASNFFVREGQREGSGVDQKGSGYL